ncbi:MAG: UDP-N-acetylmuramoyl-tripeptide--D-alanyl-D-alanine ligase [Lachnospiraceae bacterium]|nr:UDP-N-acetylmuramoyl-tripeptide--D-alanyl-D-alanine ligase [Lachnospiraceae bacterium]
MKDLTLKNIETAVSGRYHGPQALLEKTIDGACLDSRLVQKDWLFFATKGEKTNGHNFLKQIYEVGALCAITERELTSEDLPEGMKIEDAAYIQVSDSFAALRKLAAFYRSRLSVKVVGITGSVGKTSTKEMIAAVLSAKYRVLKTEKNFNNAVGLPLTILRLREEDEVAVLEMGISDFGEMAVLSSMARPDIGVITNIGQCHLENLGTRDGIFRAKSEFFGYLTEGGRVVLNGGDDILSKVKDVHGREPVFFNDEKGSYATDVEDLGFAGTRCLIHTKERTLHADIPVPGEHQVINACAAVAVAELLGLTTEQIESGIRGTQVIEGRGRVIKTDRYTLVDDCYNANPVSMKAGLKLLCRASGRRVAVLGDMFELGTDEKQLHRSVGEAMADAEYRPDVLVCIGDLAANIYDGAGDKVEKYLFADKEAFLKEKDAILKEKDVILLKASHGMAFPTLVEKLSLE